MNDRCDLAIVGGGLAGCLIAYALAQKRPDLVVRLIEKSDQLGGNHIWSFFSTDIAPEDCWIIEPFIGHHWDGYSIRFPNYHRTLETHYHSIRSQDFDQKVRALLPTGTIIQGSVQALSATQIILEGGERLEATGVIDARGPAHLDHIDARWQKFVGQEYRTKEPHGLTQPIIMDATCEQTDGYRFVYVLPFAEDRLFVEDTYYSDTPQLDPSALRQRLTRYTDEQGWQIADVLHEEDGVLPVVLGGNFEAFWDAGTPGVAKVGARAGLFHPMTGFSLPDAVRTAAAIAKAPDLSSAALYDQLHVRAALHWHMGRFYRLLARMLFLEAVPSQRRYAIMQRFYQLNRSLIERFYAGRTPLRDKIRILTGKPPVPIRAAMKVLREK